MAQEDHWLPGFNFNVEEWDDEGQSYEALAICRTLALARAAFAAAIAGNCGNRKIPGCAGLWDRGNTAKSWRGMTAAILRNGERTGGR